MEKKAPRNRTIRLSEKEKKQLNNKIINASDYSGLIFLDDIVNKTILGDAFEFLKYLPDNVIDLIIIDPPYNIDRKFNSKESKSMPPEEYEKWLSGWIPEIKRILKGTGSFYICGDWQTSTSIYNVISKYFTIRNRITWEREKGRGAKTNWKNCSEDIWFCTAGNSYVFNLDDVKMKRRVIAPYRSEGGKPKDWSETDEGNFRTTHPSNLWTDISIPFWSMPENTDHPTQKPEKLLAKIILASSNEGDLIFDPFVGSGTTSVVAKKLNRKYIGVDADEYYCCLTEKRLEMAETEKTIQGYHDGVFWERNSLKYQNRKK